MDRFSPEQDDVAASIGRNAEIGWAGLAGVVLVTSSSIFALLEIFTHSVPAFNALDIGLVRALTGALLIASGSAILVLINKGQFREMNAVRRKATHLEFAEARHESFWRNTPDSLFSAEVRSDDTFLFRGINHAHERLTGLRAKDIVGKRPDDCLPPDLASHVSGKYRECVSVGYTITYEQRSNCRAGVDIGGRALSRSAIQ